MAKCPKCGRENASYIIYCGNCGTEIPDELRRATREKEAAEEAKAAEAAPRRPSQPSASVSHPPRMTTCLYCGADHEADLRMCPSCGRLSGGPWEEQDDIFNDGESVIAHGASGSLVAGGVLAMLAGVLALGQGILYATASSIVPYEMTGFMCLCGGIGILFGLGSIAGGVFAVGRKHFGLALLGAILGMLGIGFVIGFILGLIALLLIATSKSEFES